MPPIALADSAAATMPSSGSILAILLLFVLGSGAVLLGARFIRTVHLALGFAATTTLWALGYVAMMRPGFAAGELIFAAMLAVLFGAGWVAGRYGDRTVRPTVVGLVSATANLLVLGAFLRDEQHGSRATPLLWVVGLFAISALLAWAGGALGRRGRDANDRTDALPPPASLFAWVAAATVFLLLVTGGLVTGLESGLAVPDWPNSFGHNMLLYPISEMKGGIYYEHAHRLYGMLVGTTALVLVSVLWREDRRGWVRMLSLALLAMVCVQGLMGGLRVTGRITLEQDPSLLSPSTHLAIAHGVFGQIVFAVFLIVAAATTRTWLLATPKARLGSTGDRDSAAILPALLVVQLVLGAMYRHLQPEGGGGPTAADHPMWAIYAHIAMAIVVTAAVILAGGRAWAHDAHPILRRLGQGLAALTGVQLLLGIVAVAAVWTRPSGAISIFEVVSTTLHQATGALILGGAVLLAAWSRRLLLPEPERGWSAADEVTRSRAPA